MKTLSQNTTSSVSAPETDLQQLVASLVPDEQRISFWPQHFGLIPQWVTLEPRIFGWMDRLCEDYCGGIWNLYTLNNGGAFMAPEPDDDDDETWAVSYTHLVAQGTRHSMKASSDNNDFRARGWGWLGSLETGLPFSITDNLMLEPQLQYTWQGLSLDDGQDNAGYVKFGHGSTQHMRAGFRLGSHNDMTFGEGTSSRDTLRDSAKHSVRELPVNWWVQPSVIRTFSSRGDMSMGTAAAGSNMTFSPSQNGTSLDLQAGLEARVRENITLGVQAGYAHSVSGSSAEGYNGQATLNVTF